LRGPLLVGLAETVQQIDNWMFVFSTTDAIGTTWQRVHPGFGVPYEITDVNLKTSSLQYDAFGRQVKAVAPSRVTTDIAYRSCAPYGMCVRTTTSADGFEEVFTDRLGQTVRTVTKDFRANDILTDRTYDKLGRLAIANHPRFADETAVVAARLTYDNAGRVTSSCRQGTALCTTTTYDGLRRRSATRIVR
jgi:hypothetical protein